ncbi:MAG: hypothetical protein L3J43_11190, partial [Sulfurovum sp.]|nr:hypothetical protein [Sulfurovum sp.]
NIEKKNCIIYGENGTGKSSVYWSLVSVFKKDLIDISDFKNRDISTTDELKVVITLDNNKELNLDETNALVEENRKTIFFAHQDMLEEFLVYSDNFFDILNKKIKNYFTKINDFSSELDKFNKEVDENNHEEKVPLRVKLTEEYKKFLDELLAETNNIINNYFDEKFTINFKYDWGRLDLSRGDYTFISPEIILQIEEQPKLKLQFNEAKLKLVSIALFFALIKLEEDEENSLKLLVLDDFLTSLDMSNRKLIVQYILENFGDYQKIILTHNIQFYNLIVKLLKMKGEDETWDIKRLFLSSLDNNEVSEIRDEKSFLNQAEDRLREGDLSSSGNFLRKEFERIIHEFEMLLELGKVEDMSNILDVLKEPRVYFKNPHERIVSFINSFKKIMSLPQHVTSEEKLLKIEKQITDLQSSKIDLNWTETLEDKTTKQHSILLSLQKTNFYNGVILNSLSHDDTEIEAYRKECINIIGLLTSLNKGLAHLKGKKYP